MSKPLKDASIPFREHLVELRQRIIKSLLVITFFFIVTFNYSREILNFLSKPLLPFLTNGNMVYLNLSDGFFLFFKVSLVVALVLSAPFIIYQIFMFMAPGLYDNEKRFIKILIAIASLSFITGFILLYQIVLPIFFSFFSKFIFDFYEVFPRADDYLDFVLKFNLYAGVLFMIPFGVFILDYAKILPLQRLVEIRPGVIIISFILAAAITPPDVISQILVSAIILILFETGILVTKIKHAFFK
ncbi:MAG: twin-arginine translocase subunit TatC [bacterium]